MKEREIMSTSTLPILMSPLYNLRIVRKVLYSKVTKKKSYITKMEKRQEANCRIISFFLPPPVWINLENGVTILFVAGKLIRVFKRTQSYI